MPSVDSLVEGPRSGCFFLPMCICRSMAGRENWREYCEHELKVRLVRFSSNAFDGLFTRSALVSAATVLHALARPAVVGTIV